MTTDIYKKIQIASTSWQVGVFVHQLLGKHTSAASGPSSFNHTATAAAFRCADHTLSCDGMTRLGRLPNIQKWRMLKSVLHSKGNSRYHLQRIFVNVTACDSTFRLAQRILKNYALHLLLTLETGGVKFFPRTQCKYRIYGPHIELSDCNSLAVMTPRILGHLWPLHQPWDSTIWTIFCKTLKRSQFPQKKPLNPNLIYSLQRKITENSHTSHQNHIDSILHQRFLRHNATSPVFRRDTSYIGKMPFERETLFFC